MSSKPIFLILALAGLIFFHYYNGNQILRKTQELSRLEKKFQAERNINTELMIEHDDLVSGRNIASLVPVEMTKFVSKEVAGNVVFIQEPAKQKTAGYYCIIDLLTPKAEAITTVQPD